MVTLIGMGSGKWEALSAQAQQAVRSAGLVFGAKRLLAGLSADCTARQFALYQPADILETLAQNPGQDAAVLYSGDTGFYSGASGLLTPLRALGIPARVYPGVSSIQLLSAALGRPWQDWKLVSAHGCACDPVAECMMNRSVFFLTGGIMIIAAALTSEGTGIATAMAMYLVPVVSKASIIAFVAIIIIALCIFSQFSMNMVLQMVFAPILAPILLASGYNPLIAVMAVYFGTQLAFLAPSGSMMAAMVFAKSDWVKPSHIYKICVPWIIVSMAAFIIMSLVLPDLVYTF